MGLYSVHWTLWVKKKNLHPLQLHRFAVHVLIIIHLYFTPLAFWTKCKPRNLLHVVHWYVLLWFLCQHCICNDILYYCKEVWRMNYMYISLHPNFPHRISYLINSLRSGYFLKLHSESQQKQDIALGHYLALLLLLLFLYFVLSIQCLFQQGCLQQMKRVLHSPPLEAQSVHSSWWAWA